MPCFRPHVAWRYLPEKRQLVFGEHPHLGSADWEMQLTPCRECIGCEDAAARDWATKCYCESKLHDRNCFLTLTYDQAHVPPHRMLRKRDVTLFIKRLRKHFAPVRLRYFYVGEYGTRTWRPHYHLCGFGFDLDDKKAYGKSKGGFPLYESATLDRLWGMGKCTVQDMTAETAYYAAGYCTKKRDPHKTTTEADQAKWVPKKERARVCIDTDTGEKYRYVPEFHEASTRPTALGIGFLERYPLDVWTAQGIVLPDGHINPIPQSFLAKIQQWCEDDYNALKDARREKALQRIGDTMPNRLEVREICTRARLALSGRDRV